MTVKRSLLTKGVSSSILETFTLREVIARETRGNERSSLLDKCASLELLQRITALDGSVCEELKTLTNAFRKQAERLVTELIRHNLAEYYFLNQADISETGCAGYVVLLRRMQTLVADVARNLPAGIEPNTPQGVEAQRHGITFANQPVCMLTGVLRSPDIEHLTQQLATLFTRIGLEDHDEATISQHLQLLIHNTHPHDTGPTD